MSEGDAVTRAEKPGPPRRAGGGTAEGTGLVRQADTARRENAGEETPSLMEEVLRRENMFKAYRRVLKNKGAPGVDGITVGKLPRALQARWERP